MNNTKLDSYQDRQQIISVNYKHQNEIIKLHGYLL